MMLCDFMLGVLSENIGNKWNTRYLVDNINFDYKNDNCVLKTCSLFHIRLIAPGAQLK